MRSIVRRVISISVRYPIILIHLTFLLLYFSNGILSVLSTHVPRQTSIFDSALPGISQGNEPPPPEPFFAPLANRLAFELWYDSQYLVQHGLTVFDTIFLLAIALQCILLAQGRAVQAGINSALLMLVMVILLPNLPVDHKINIGGHGNVVILAALVLQAALVTQGANWVLKSPILETCRRHGLLGRFFSGATRDAGCFGLLHAVGVCVFGIWAYKAKAWHGAALRRFRRGSSFLFCWAT